MTVGGADQGADRRQGRGRRGAERTECLENGAANATRLSVPRQQIDKRGNGRRITEPDQRDHQRTRAHAEPPRLVRGRHYARRH
nr:hypothetical protein [Streptomyces davaonensis]